MQSTVLVVEDDRPLCEALCETLQIGGFDALPAVDGEHAMGIMRDANVDLVVTDVQMPNLDGHALLRRIKTHRPELPVLVMTAFGTIQNAVRAIQDGAADYLVKPFEPEVLVAKVNELVSDPVGPEVGFIAIDPRTLEVPELARRVAASDATVMITGESGVGKEVLFRFIHKQSKRGAKPAVAINCAAIPENMLEAILFGYEKGAFTGAYKPSAGKFELAQGGTLLMDEISEMSLTLQAKLLRVLQERQVERLGGHRVTDLDVRVVGTTNRDLRSQVADGRFREDLYYRMNVFLIDLPPLRQRVEDILPLARHFLEQAASRSAVNCPRLSEEAGLLLKRHPWRGNVRELDNVMQRAVIVQTGGVIGARDLRFEHFDDVTSEQLEAGSLEKPNDSLGADLKEREWDLIIKALGEGKGSRKYASEALGVSPRTLRYKIARLRELGYEIPR